MFQVRRRPRALIQARLDFRSPTGSRESRAAWGMRELETEL